MPSRRDIFLNRKIYHVYNKSIEDRKIFDGERVARYFLQLLRYYRSSKAKIRHSEFKRLQGPLRRHREKELSFSKYFKAHILAYVLMPNHFHILLMQRHDGGIVRLMADLQNAITRYFNIMNHRKGPIFLTQFKSKRIMSDEQLIHVSRYIHLNPYSSRIVDSFEELINYPLSSLGEYTRPDREGQMCNTDTILRYFEGSREGYLEFVRSNADHQRALEFVKHAEKWS